MYDSENSMVYGNITITWECFFPHNYRDYLGYGDATTNSYAKLVYTWFGEFYRDVQLWTMVSDRDASDVELQNHRPPRLLQYLWNIFRISIEYLWIIYEYLGLSKHGLNFRQSRARQSLGPLAVSALLHPESGKEVRDFDFFSPRLMRFLRGCRVIVLCRKIY